MYIVLCASVFLLAYLLNTLTVTVGYHRGLAHQALTLRPMLRKLVIVGGNWLTGIDPKAWVVMHRMHHAYSDTPQDPHSPLNVGVLGIGLAQLRSYKRAIIGLAKEDPAFTRFATDLDFPLNRLNRARVWYIPYVLHGVIGLGLAVGIGPLLGAAYYFGVMSHPIQGGLVNSLGHAYGGRNFATNDNSRNNHLVAWLIMGEGYQNNHHHRPASATFAYARGEVDFGYLACKMMRGVGMIELRDNPGDSWLGKAARTHVTQATYAGR